MTGTLTQPRAASAERRLRIAFFDFADVFEDFYPHYGVDQRAFATHWSGTSPTTLICPGDEWTNPALEVALDLGIRLVSSYYLALRHEGRFCWSTHICAPYLGLPDATWFDSGLPLVGYFHDYEPALFETPWLTRHLDAWQDAGARHWIDFRELASALTRALYVDSISGVLRVLSVDGEAVEPVRSLPIRIYDPRRAGIEA